MGNDIVELCTLNGNKDTQKAALKKDNVRNKNNKCLQKQMGFGGPEGFHWIRLELLCILPVPLGSGIRYKLQKQTPPN
jgi:hypothetical protein